MSTSPRPALNPVLALNREARPAPVTGRSHTEAHVRAERLETQRERLSLGLARLTAPDQQSHGGRLLFIAKMFDDSLAPTWEPQALFRRAHGATLVAPARDGYLVQAQTSELPSLMALIGSSTSLPIRVAISRIEEILPIDQNIVLRGRDAELIWEQAVDIQGGKAFTAWLAPYDAVAARDSVVSTLLEYSTRGVIQPIRNLVTLTREPGSDSDQLQLQTAPSQTSIARSAREYREKQFAKVTIAAPSPQSLAALASSGAVYRIDPVKPLAAAEVPTGADPDRPVPDEQWHPIVGIIDGGLHAASYERMRAWEAPSLVADVIADRSHGNRIASLIVHGHGWNTHLHLPELTCRIGTAQAIAKGPDGPTRVEFLSYLRSVIERHAGSTKVWNLSFNEPAKDSDPLEMSELGHEIHKLAREFDILPVISIGNVAPGNSERLCPPADCEAALTVGGCLSDGTLPGDHCPACLKGPGPEGLQKPEMSWFSTLRGLGGSPATGSSFATAITSSVAAHAFHSLKAPTPDLVRALLINKATRETFDRGLGWGAPYGDALPWQCSDGSVTLVWTAKLRPGFAYYWEDIPIPPEMIRDGRIYGKGVLTAVLRPLVSELGSSNYFASRLQVALQYTMASGATGNLLGTMREDIAPEQTSRREYAKWNPVRHHAEDFSSRGRAFRGTNFRLYARIFARDLYQFGVTENSELEPQEVAFALTLSSASTTNSSSLYDSVAQRLGTYVESAVNDVEIQLEQ